MIINNLTPQTLRVRLKEISGDKNEYDIFIQPHGSTEVSQVTVVNADPRLLAITSDPYQVPIPNTSSPVKDAIEEEPEKPVEEVVEEKTPVEDSKFICDICGAEFASSRGLARHKSSSHSEE